MIFLALAESRFDAVRRDDPDLTTGRPRYLRNGRSDAGAEPPYPP
jgi:hypothetical protein